MLAIRRKSLTTGALFGGVTLFLVAIGTFLVFSGKYVISGAVSLSDALLLMILAGAGFVAAAAGDDAGNAAANGAVSGATVGTFVAVFTLLARSVNLRQIFPNVSPELINLLSFGQEGVGGLMLMVILGATAGALGGLARLVPPRQMGIVLFAGAIVLVVGLLQNAIEDLVTLVDATILLSTGGVGYVIARSRGSELADSLGYGALAGLVVALLVAITLPLGGPEDNALIGEVMIWLQGNAIAVVIAIAVLGAVLGVIARVTGQAEFDEVLRGMGVPIPRPRREDDKTLNAILAGISGVLIGLVAGLVLLLLMAALIPMQREFASMITKSESDLLSAFWLGKEGVGRFVVMALLGAIVGALGGMLTVASGAVHSAGLSLVSTIMILGVLQSAGEVNVPVAIAIAGIVVFVQVAGRSTSMEAATRYNKMPEGKRRTVNLLGLIVAAFLLLMVPQVFNQYITSVLDLVGLYTMMGLGLNIVVGYAGLLDLGYVAFFAIGAYITGILTTPNLVTCGGVRPEAIDPAMIGQVCTGVTTFWVAWPVAMLAAALAGILLGIPVLRMRGDYLAIVTLGFGEIIRLIALSDTFADYLGGAQGITQIPSPMINLSALAGPLSSVPFLEGLAERLREPIVLTSANEIYYLILAGVLIAAFVSFRLSGSRLGRAWMAMREDEDVAQAMGINLVNVKLLAFTTGAAFSGIGGAVFGSWLHSIFPNSFTLLVSINILCLIIIGGMGSIPGVLIGAFVLIGLPEALREFADYRLLAFGALLVIMMLVKPAGLMPPPVRRLEAEAEAIAQEEEGA